MEALDDDDFSDLYADVELQASFAIRAFNGLAKMPPTNDIIYNAATGGEKGKGCSFIGTELARGNGGIHDRPTVSEEEGGGWTELPSENGDTCDGGIENEGNDVIKQKFGVTNTGKNGGTGIGEDETKHVVIDGNEKSTSCGDYGHGHRRKNLNYDSLITKKRKVDDMAHQIHKPGKNADADVGNDRDICCSRGSEDNLPDFGRNDVGDKVASGRGSQHSRAWDPENSDLDKYGSLQLSDSEGDNHHEVSDCDSDEMLEATEKSDIPNRRNASCSSDKVPSLAESESSQSGCSHHDSGSSSPSSASAALSNDDIEKRCKYSRNSLINRDYHPSNYSRSHTIKPSIEDGRYCQRQRGFIGKELNQHKEYSDTPDLKTYLTDEDSSYANYVKRSRHISQGKRREVLNFDSIEKDMPYCNQSENLFTQFGGVFHDYHSKNRNWNFCPSKRYKRDGHYMRERQDFIGKRNSKMDYEATEDNWYRKQMRHVVQGNMEASRKLVPKYHSSAFNTRDAQFSNKGNAMHFRRTKRDYLSPLRDYNNDTKEKSRRFMPSSDGHRDYTDHRYGQNVDRERREIESSRMGNRKSDIPHISSDNLWYGEAAENGRRPKYGFPVRNMRCSCKEMHIECGHYGTKTAIFDTRERLRYHLSENQHVRSRHSQRSTTTYITNGSIKDHRDQDYFVRSRHHEQSQPLHSREEVYKSWQQNDTIFDLEGPSYHHPKNLSNNRPDDRHAFGRVEEYIGERELDRRRRFKQIREEYSRNQFDGCLKFIEADKCVQMRQRYRYPVDSRLVVVDNKCTTRQSSRRTSEAGDGFIGGENDLTEWNDNLKPKSENFEDLGYFKQEKAASTNERKVDTANLSDKSWLDKFSENPNDEFLDIEEGQIISEEIDNHIVKSVIVSEDKTQINDTGIPEISSNSIAVVERLGDERIQEIMAKMERRRERFKEHITLGRDSEKSSNQSLNLSVETSVGKLERPARKRRWF